MSLDVPTAVLDAAEPARSTTPRSSTGPRRPCRTPGRWSPGRRRTAHAAGAVRRPRDAAAVARPERGQLLRALASDAIRGALERHFGVVLAFQNCHRVAAFAPAAVDGDAYRAFVGPRAQLLHQSPELRDC